METKRPDPGKLFDQATEAAFASATGRTSISRRRKMLRTTQQPKVVQMREIPRHLDLVDQGLRKIFRGLVSGELRWPLYLWGPVGTGKTLAALCLCDHILDSRYTTVEELVDAVVDRDLSEWRGLRESLLVVLDELGERQRDIDVHRIAVQRLAGIRERRRSVAVYVSNLPPTQLVKQYDDRIVSRLCCGTRFELKGADRRLED